jgi:acetyl-CoA carboxylase carboxyltransferase component
VFPDREHFGRIFYNQANMSAAGIPQVRHSQGKGKGKGKRSAMHRTDSPTLDSS